MKFAISCLVALCAGSANSTIFIDAYSPITWFLDFADSPYHPKEPFYSHRNITVDIGCKEILDQQAELEALSLEEKRVSAQLEVAIANNDRTRQEVLQKAQAELMAKMRAGKIRKVVLESKPIFGQRGLRASDPLAAFLLKAALRGADPAAVIADTKFTVLVAALPTRALKVTYSSGRYDGVDFTFASTTAPSIESWKNSVGRKKSTYPVTLVVGKNPYWGYCEQVEYGSSRTEGCLATDYAVTLDLTAGQFCNAMTGADAAFLVAKSEFKSSAFAGEQVDLTTRIGFSARSTRGDLESRREGHEQGIDKLVKDFLVDALNAQMYRVSGARLEPYQPRYVLNEGSTSTYYIGDNQFEARVRSLRDGLNALNDTLASAGQVPPPAAMTAALTTPGRYKGVRVRGADEVRDIAEFSVPGTSPAAVFGFMVMGTKVRVAYVSRGNELFYADPLFRCSPGSYCPDASGSD